MFKGWLQYRPVCQVPSRLQTHSAPTWLTQSISFEDYETVRVGHQQVKTKVKACPPPAVLRRGKYLGFFCRNQTYTLYGSKCYCRSEIVRLTSPSLVSFLPHLMLLSSNSSLFASWGLMTDRCIQIILYAYSFCGCIKQSTDITIVQCQLLTHYRCQTLSGA